MKKIKFLLFLILTNFAFAQNKLFLYDYKFIPDSTNRDDLKDEVMILNIQKDRSEFYSFEKYSSDSTRLAESNKGNIDVLSDKEMISDRIIKYSGSNLINYITFISMDKYIVKENIELKWKLENIFSRVLNYDVQKATTEYGGRKWNAWFTKEIPIQDGPYKFKNLPGLIVKIEDIHKNHIFELVGIKNNTSEFTYPNMKYYKELNVSYDQYAKKFRNNRINPTSDLIGQIPDQTDSEGNFRTAAQVIKHLNDIWLERFKKENNIIEIELLK